jgi:hypothetical protein
VALPHQLPRLLEVEGVVELAHCEQVDYPPQVHLRSSQDLQDCAVADCACSGHPSKCYLVQFDLGMGSSAGLQMLLELLGMDDAPVGCCWWRLGEGVM